MIWREVVRTRAAGEPVVVSMGDVAASGGYYIATAADAIVAQPGTITGSIGVIMGKPVLEEAFERLAVTAIRCPWAAGRNVRARDPFRDDDWQRINRGWMRRPDFTIR